MKETFYESEFIVEARIRSENNDYRKVRILEWDHDEDTFIVRYGDLYCEAVLNTKASYTLLIDVDDIAGKLKPDGHGGYKAAW